MPILQIKSLLCLGAALTIGLSSTCAQTVDENKQEKNTSTQSDSKEDNKDQSTRKTTEPVYRVSKTPDFDKSKSAPPKLNADPNARIDTHPLDEALKLAYQGHEHIKGNIFDYTATMLKRERINGKLSGYEKIEVKIRNGRKTENGKIPFSIYMQFVEPSSGREVIWVEGKNNGKLIAHEGGRLNLISVQLVPDGMLAMRGNRYPIYEAGIENLVIKLIEKGERDRKAGPCDVKFYTENVKVDNRPCTMLQVLHREKKHPYDFYVARVFMDNEYKVPVRYAAYSWPTTKGGRPILEEEYTYTNLKFNVGLTDADFDPTNGKYNYPKRGLK